MLVLLFDVHSVMVSWSQRCSIMESIEKLMTTQEDVEEGEKLLVRGPREEVQGDETTNAEEVDFESLAQSTLPPIDPEKQLQRIMDCILPPRVYESEGKIWKESTSTMPATRQDIAKTQEKFEAELDRRKAKAFGICPIRRDIYDQLFDELIRQVTVTCAERGLMLLRVRDELRLTVLSYQHLLESAIAYGIRKAICVEHQQSIAVFERDECKKKNHELTLHVEELERQMHNLRRVNEEELQLLEERMRDENERLREANKTLKHQLTALLQMDQDFRTEHQPPA